MRLPGRRQRKVGNIRQHEIRLVVRELLRLRRHAGRPIGMEGAVTCAARSYIHVQRAMHDKAEIAGTGNVLEGTGNAPRQAFARQAATNGQLQIGQARAQRIQHRRGLRQMPEAVGGNIDEKMWCQRDIFYKTTWVPSSITRLGGKLKKFAMLPALRNMAINSFSRHNAIPEPILGMSVSRPKKKEVSITSKEMP